MTAATWTVRGTGCTAEKQNASGRLLSGLFGIKNQSDYDVEVRHLLMEISQGFDSIQTVNPQTIYRITSVSDGMNLTVVKSDSNSAALPSQVRVVSHPASITEAGIIARPGQLRGTRTGNTSNAVSPFGSRVGTAPYSIMAGWQRSGGHVQPIVLREGEGIAWLQRSGVSPHVQYGHVVFRNQASGASYNATTRAIPVGEQDTMLVVFNGSGSGIILEVIRIESHDVGFPAASSNDTAELSHPISVMGYRMMKCTDLINGEAVTPVPRDTANTALPSTIQVFTNPQVVLGDAGRSGDYANRIINQVNDGQNSTQNYGVLYALQLAEVIRGWPRDPTESWFPGSANFPRLMEGPYRRLYRTRGSNVPGIVLKKGECLAIVYMYRHIMVGQAGVTMPDDEGLPTLVNYNFNAEFTTQIVAGTQISAPVVPPSGATIIT